MSEPETYLQRHLIPELEEALNSSRIVNLIGPRQAGKTTLVRDLFDHGRFITLDDATVLEAMEADPSGQLRSLLADTNDGPLIIDEAQRSKKLALAIKRIVDSNRKKGQFVLTGSSNVFTTTEVADSLAGRMRTIKLWPLSIAETKHKPVNRVLDWAAQDEPDLSQLDRPENINRKGYIDLVLRGGFPEMRSLDLRPRQKQYRDYIDAIVDKDVADIMRIRKTDALRHLIEQMAARTAAELNVSEMAKLIKLRRETIEQYLNVLMRLSMLTKLGAWSSGEGKREVKNPKYHFVDTGIASALRRFNEKTFDIGNTPTALGGLLESFVLNEIQKALPMQDNDFRLFHWRSADKREIDIVADAGNHLVGVEVKSSSSIAKDDFKHLKWFANDGPGRTRTCTGIVFYLGDEKLTFGDRNFALPVSSLWAEVIL